MQPTKELTEAWRHGFHCGLAQAIYIAGIVGLIVLAWCRS